jgi:hypothetical protein
MTRSIALAALLALAACGGDESKPEPYNPPVVDPTRLGVACPAPEVPIITDMWGGQRPAGELQVGDMIWAPPTWTMSAGYYAVTEAARLTGQQRVRLVLDDGREPIFTPDHAVVVDAGCTHERSPSVVLPENLKTGGYVEVQHLLPGWCLRGDIPGIVVRVENAPDGDVIRLSIGDAYGHAYYADGIYSLAHNATVGP